MSPPREFGWFASSYGARALPPLGPLHDAWTGNNASFPRACTGERCSTKEKGIVLDFGKKIYEWLRVVDLVSIANAEATGGTTSAMQWTILIVEHA